MLTAYRRDLAVLAPKMRDPLGVGLAGRPGGYLKQKTKSISRECGRLLPAVITDVLRFCRLSNQGPENGQFPRRKAE